MTVHTQFSPRQRAALASICDTFFPADNGVPSASELGVVDALLGAVAANPRAAERRQLARLLTLWDTAPLTGLGGGGLRRFSALDQAQRERVLLSWCDSRLPQRRAAFQALRNGSLTHGRKRCAQSFISPCTGGSRRSAGDRGVPEIS
jgi:long-chain-alcohol oxidase